jgi:hypothetical protein
MFTDRWLIMSPNFASLVVVKVKLWIPQKDLGLDALSLCKI